MRFSRLAFMNRFTDAELATIYSAAKVSVDVEVWLAKFNAATPDADGNSVDSEDPATAGGLHALEFGGLIAQGRAAEILGNVATETPIHELGLFRVLPPFDADFPLEYGVVGVITADDGATTYLLDQGAGGFNTCYLEQVI